MLNSIKLNNFKGSEIIVVDDGSEDNTVDIVNKYNCKLIKLKKNSGAAKARNIGVGKAKGDLLLFLDSDVVLSRNFLTKLYTRFDNNPKLKILQGIYSKYSLNCGFFPEYKALWDFFIWDSVKSNITSSFEPRCAAIKKDVFIGVGGFNDKFEGASVEDYELGYRLLKKNKIYFDKRLEVGHHFPSFRSNIVNTFIRTVMWMKLFIKRKKFDDVGTTKYNALSKSAGFFGLILINMIFISDLFLYVSLVLLIMYFISMLKFYIFVFKEKSLFFTIGAIIYDFLLSITIGIAGIFALLTLGVNRNE